MSEWAPRRFWKKAEARPESGGWAVYLDERRLNTPNKHPLYLPTRALAEAIAGEWDAQDDVIDPNNMPLTRAANSAVEKVRPQHAAVADMLSAYGGSDLLCYRADGPPTLTARQVEGWDPLLQWAAEAGAPLVVTQGVMPVEQPAGSLAVLAEKTAAHDDFALTALHDLVTLTGSLVLGLAVTAGRITAEEAFDLSRMDETFQAEEWGRDEEAESAAAARRAAVLSAARFYDLSRG